MGMLEDMLGQVLKNAGGPQTAPGRNPSSPAGANDPLTAMLAQFLGADKKDAGPILALIMQFIQANGGVPGIIEKFRKKGLTAQADSWVGTGANQAISPQQIGEVFDAKSINHLAEGMHTTPEQAKRTLADMLPELINQFTPAGEVPDNVNQMVSLFEQMLGVKK